MGQGETEKDNLKWSIENKSEGQGYSLAVECLPGILPVRGWGVAQW